MKRKCKFCNKFFTLDKSNLGQEYCSEKCWRRAHGLDKKYINHYLGGKKRKKRKKKGTI